MRMTLRRVLQKKNILAGQIKEIAFLIREKNVYDTNDAESTRVNTEEVLEKYLSEKEKLIQLKSAITVANIGIYPILARLEEAKDTITLLSSISTGEGTRKSIHMGTIVEITTIAHIKEATIRERKVALQALIEQLQEEVDEYNATHFIEVEL